MTTEMMTVDDAHAAEIRPLVQDYFDLVHTNDLAILDRIFDGNAHLYGRSEEGEVVLWPLARYRQILAGRQSPQSLGALREDRLLALDVAAATQAFAKVRVRIGQIVFLDYLTLVKLADGWKIASKTYHRLT
ncbi:nuclear transport factor 2 family protein [Paroceanicella profunda]|nr:nuclear transport factor 2 family protein [Paroceanicella profunda]